MTRRRFKLNAGRWAYVRRLALERDHYTCRECGRGGQMEVDHIQPKHKPESTEGVGRVSVLKRQEGAPLNLG